MHTLYFDNINPCIPLGLLSGPLPTVSPLVCFLYNSLSPINTARGFGATHWSMGNLLRATPLKKTDSSSPRSHQLPIIPQLGVAGLCGPSSPSTLEFWLLDLLLVVCKQPQMPWIHERDDCHGPEDTVSPKVCPPPLPQCSPSLGKGECGRYVTFSAEDLHSH